VCLGKKGIEGREVGIRFGIVMGGWMVFILGFVLVFWVGYGYRSGYRF